MYNGTPLEEFINAWTTLIPAILILCTGWIHNASAGELENDLSALTQRLIDDISGEESPRIAVLPLEGSSEMLRKAGRGTAEYILALLVQDPRFTVVDRKHYTKALEELALSQSGVIDETEALEVGKFLSAQYLITGGVSDVLGRVMINVRVIRTETAEIVSASSLSARSEQLMAFSREILGEKTQLSAYVFRSALVSGWGQLYAGKTTRGILSSSLFLGGAGVTAYMFIRTNQKKTTYDNFVQQRTTVSGEEQLRQEFHDQTGMDAKANQQAFNDYLRTENARHYSQYQSQLQNSIIALSVTGGVWALNLVDAAVAGRQKRREIVRFFAWSTGESTRAGLAIAF